MSLKPRARKNAGMTRAYRFKATIGITATVPIYPAGSGRRGIDIMPHI